MKPKARFVIALEAGDQEDPKDELTVDETTAAVPEITEIQAADAPTEAPVDAVVEAPVEEKPPAEPTAEPVAEVTPVAEAPAEVPKTLIIPGVDGEPTTIITSDELKIVETTGDEIAEIIDEAQDAVTKSEEIIEDGEKIETAAQALEAFSELIDVLKKRKQFDKTHVAAISLGVEHIYDSVDLLKPGMESMLVSKPSECGQVTIALEDIKEQAKKLMAAVLTALKKAVEVVTEFFKRIFTSHGRLKARAEQLLAVSARLSGAPAEKQVGSADLVRAIGGVRNIPQAQGELTQLVVEAAQRGGEATFKEASTLFENLFSAVMGDKEEAVKAAEEKLATVLKKMVLGSLKERAAMQGVELPDAPQGAALCTSDLLLGGKVIWAHLPIDAGSLTAFNTGVAESNANVSDGAKLQTLNGAQIKAIAEQALEFVKQTEGLQATFKAASALLLSVQQQAGRVSGARTAGEGKPLDFSFIASVMRLSVRLSRGVFQPATAVAFKGHAAALEYAAQSAKAYGKASVSAPQLAAD